MRRSSVPAGILSQPALPESLLRLKFVQNAILFILARKKLLMRWAGWKNSEKEWQKRNNKLPRARRGGVSIRGKFDLAASAAKKIKDIWRTLNLSKKNTKIF